MVSQDILTLDGYKIPAHAKSIVFYEFGKAKVEEVITPKDIYENSLVNSNGRWGVLIQPYSVGLCLSDQAGGRLSFPPGNTRSFGSNHSPAVAGHEFVGKVVAANQQSLKQLTQKGIKLGDIVVGDINVGCGDCFQCNRNDPPLYCDNGVTFVGIGSSPKASWVKAQTGRPHLPGAYTEGFLVLPASNVYKVPMNKVKNANRLVVFSQADAVACAKTSCDVMGITNFKQMRGFDDPYFLIAGAGRLGAWHVAIARELLPNIRIYLADIDEENLNTVGNLFNIPEDQRYFIPEGSDQPYSRKNLKAGFGTSFQRESFDFIVDTAGHGTFDGETVTRVLRESVANGGVFCTTSHIGMSGLDTGHPDLILGMKRFVNSLSPKNNFSYAMAFLSANLKTYAPFMVEIKGGLNPKLAEIVASGGGTYKNKMRGTTFYSIINLVELNDLLLGLKSQVSISRL